MTRDGKRTHRVLWAGTFPDALSLDRAASAQAFHRRCELSLSVALDAMTLRQVPQDRRLPGHTAEKTPGKFFRKAGGPPSFRQSSP
jgi:hypothetical protein